jgi:hypothetical protein
MTAGLPKKKSPQQLTAHIHICRGINDGINAAGFEDLKLVRETGLNSSGKTKGVLIKALKKSSRK